MNVKNFVICVIRNLILDWLYIVWFKTVVWLRIRILSFLVTLIRIREQTDPDPLSTKILL